MIARKACCQLRDRRLAQSLNRFAVQQKWNMCLSLYFCLDQKKLTYLRWLAQLAGPVMTSISELLEICFRCKEKQSFDFSAHPLIQDLNSGTYWEPCSCTAEALYQLHRDSWQTRISQDSCPHLYCGNNNLLYFSSSWRCCGN